MEAAPGAQCPAWHQYFVARARGRAESGRGDKVPPGGPMGARPRSRPMARRGGVAAARQVITQLGAAEVPDPGPPPPPHIIQCMQSSLAPPSPAQPCISGGELRDYVQNVLHVSTSPGLHVSGSRCRLYLEMADDVPSIWAALSRDTAAPRLPANFCGKYLQSQSIRAASCCCMWVESWTTLPSPVHHWHGRGGVVLSVDRCSAEK